MRRVYRVCRSVHAALDGRGAALAGGRWNTPGRSLVYTADSMALAVLENMVHMSVRDFPSGYVSVSAVIPSTIAILDELDARTRWPEARSPAELGDRWID